MSLSRASATNGLATCVVLQEPEPAHRVWRGRGRILLRAARTRPIFPTTDISFRRPISSRAKNSPGASAWSSRSVTSAWPRARGSWGHRVHGRFSTLEIWQRSLHRGFRRPELCGKSCLGDGHRFELVPELLHQALSRLAALRIRQSRGDRTEPFRSTRDLFWLRFQVFF